MNAIVVLLLGLVVCFIGYRFYAKYIDTKIMQADEKRVTPAKMYMDGVEFMPTSKNILYGYQFKSIAGAGPIIGPDHRDSVGVAARAALDPAGNLFHRLGSRLLQRDDCHAKRRGLLRRSEPPAHFSESHESSSSRSSISTCCSSSARSETSWSAPPSGSRRRPWPGCS